jgi:hypothetical protein
LSSTPKEEGEQLEETEDEEELEKKMNLHLQVDKDKTEFTKDDYKK